MRSGPETGRGQKHRAPEALTRAPWNGSVCTIARPGMEAVALLGEADRVGVQNSAGPPCLPQLRAGSEIDAYVAVDHAAATVSLPLDVLVPAAGRVVTVEVDPPVADGPPTGG